MMNWLILYKKDTLQIDHFISNSFQMPVLTDFKVYNSDIYSYVKLVNPVFEINRNRKVTLENGKVVGTEVSINPIQPEPPEPVMDYKAEILKLQDEIKKLKEAKNGK